MNKDLSKTLQKTMNDIQGLFVEALNKGLDAEHFCWEIVEAIGIWDVERHWNVWERLKAYIQYEEMLYESDRMCDECGKMSDEDKEISKVCEHMSDECIEMARKMAELYEIIYPKEDYPNKHW